MYSIDVNFLRDRKLDGLTTGTSFTNKPPTPMAERVPLFIGGGVALACIAAAFGALLLLKTQKAETEKQIANLETEITRLQGQSNQLQEFEKKIKALKEETDSFVSVFNTIKPWSAMLEEISSVIPANVQIDSITQSDKNVLTITGTAQSYDDVGDFVLNLKKSQFINPENTKLTSGTFAENPNSVKDLEAINKAANQKGNTQNATVSDPAKKLDIELPMVVSYTIDAEISDVPAPELINTLKRRGADGLVARLNFLREKGAIETKGVVKP